jgi:hypothetical protein
MAVMKNLYEVLRSKEMDIARIRAEIQALRGVIPLLEDEISPAYEPQRRPLSVSPEPNRWPLDLNSADRRNPGS